MHNIIQITVYNSILWKTQIFKQYKARQGLTTKHVRGMVQNHYMCKEYSYHSPVSCSSIVQLSMRVQDITFLCVHVISHIFYAYPHICVVAVWPGYNIIGDEFKDLHATTP